LSPYCIGFLLKSESICVFGTMFLTDKLTFQTILDSKNYFAV